jgi:hypothetical protein
LGEIRLPGGGLFHVPFISSDNLKAFQGPEDSTFAGFGASIIL